MQIRGQDGFTTAYQFITDHLDPYSYLDSEEIHILKLKIMILDGVISEEEAEAGVVDEDYEFPKDHLRWLRKELTALDLYVRTEDDLLEENEVPYGEDQQNRVEYLEYFLKSVNPETEELYQDYEMEYESRPSYFTTEQLEELYTKYKIKEGLGQLTSAKDYLDSVTDQNYDYGIYENEQTLKYLKTPEQIYADILEQAEEQARTQDNPSVREMNRIYDELWLMFHGISGLHKGDHSPYRRYYNTQIVDYEGDTYICRNTHDSLPFSLDNFSPTLTDWTPETVYTPWCIVRYVDEAPDPDETHYYFCIQEHESPSLPGSPLGDVTNWIEVDNFITYDANNIGFINMPQRRYEVELNKNDLSHKGPILRLLNTGGYRFGFLKMEEDPEAQTTFASSWKDEPLTATYDYNYNDLEDDFDEVEVCLFETFWSGSSEVYTRAITSASLPYGGDGKWEISKARFDFLNKRWKDLNEEREYQYLDTGTRSILEGMVNADITDIRPSLEARKQNLEDLKESTTKVLTEITGDY